MYLISIYFDEKTNKILQRYIDRIAEKSGNSFMIENKVPPHIILGKTLDNIAVKDNQSSRGSGIIPGPLEC